MFDNILKLLIAISMLLASVNFVQIAHINKQQGKINQLLTIEVLELKRQVK
jgi:hypothetical protein